MPEADVFYLDLADYLLVAEAIVGISAEVLGASDRIVPLAESALHAPQAGFGGVELLSGSPGQGRGPVRAPGPLPDGNKRIAFICLVEFLERNGPGLVPPDGPDPDEEIASVIEQVASGGLAEDRFAEWLRIHTRASE